MPANLKYLSSPSQRFAKITAGFFGGYMVSISFHLLLAGWLAREIVIITMTFTGFLLWCGLLVLAFIAKRGWVIWGLYLGISLLCSLGIYLAKV